MSRSTMYSTRSLHGGETGYSFKQTTQKSSNAHPLLLDVTETFLSGMTSRLNSQREHQQNNSEFLHTVLWYNIPDWISLAKTNECMKTCHYDNDCQFVTDIHLLKQSSAVIYCLTTRGIGKTPPLNIFERPRNQVWVFFAMESPVHLQKHYNHLRPDWENSFNWSMNFRVDSDIVMPYGYLKTRKVIPQRNYSEIYRNKKKFAAWVVSNCRTVGKREKFVKKLKEYGLDIDVYGACGEKLNGDPNDMISRDYKFYLSLENSICSDYITEKFFRYMPLNAVMVVRGGSDYKRLLPDKTYIDSADFDSFEKTVEYLKAVSGNETLYTEYLKAKDKYDSVHQITDVCPSFCALCMKLNDLENNRKVYEIVPDYLKTCHPPDDINRMDNKRSQ